MAKLDFYRDHRLFLSVKLASRSIVIGRGEHCDVQLPDHRVSRSHARIELDAEGVYWIENLSPNGTRMNAAMVEGRQPITPGDRLYIQDYVAILLQDHLPSNPRWSEPTVPA